MSQPPQSPRSASPLTARLYDLEYPRSLGVYNTYQEVQSVVDTLADKQFPVQSTLIVGTDLKLMERVTGRRTWPKVISQGALSGLWMGLFLGLLLLLLSPGNLTVILTSVVLGIVFFTVSSVIGYTMSGGRRDFTSMTATIPMQYELLVEHKHAAQAQRILAESGAAPAPVQAPGAAGAPAPQSSAPYGTAPGRTASDGQAPYGAGSYGTDRPGGQAYQAPGSQGDAPASSVPSPSRPSYGRPAASSAPPSAPPRSGRPSFGMPAGAPLREEPVSQPTSEGSPSVGAAGPVGTPAGSPQQPDDPSEAPSDEHSAAEQHPGHEQRPGDDSRR